eukprot:gnl/TRDRNA2_/TRDRNA2_179750_c0_seq1.p2 gnl/TRDRNA2_/TRDRNA2_179750_c0~~gnl/TRDRNA2_/TRDRNA2_179750_c0_seq1.p2  ORF type:complete len:201 (+),score=29.54 gnl/TRDRNA2_/TRDRNA2_179750_c0_seq1:751-1353(+)
MEGGKVFAKAKWRGAMKPFCAYDEGGKLKMAPHRCSIVDFVKVPHSGVLPTAPTKPPLPSADGAKQIIAEGKRGGNKWTTCVTSIDDSQPYVIKPCNKGDKNQLFVKHSTGALQSIATGLCLNYGQTAGPGRLDVRPGPCDGDSGRLQDQDPSRPGELLLVKKGSTKKYAGEFSDSWAHGRLLVDRYSTENYGFNTFKWE